MLDLVAVPMHTISMPGEIFLAAIAVMCAGSLSAQQVQETAASPERTSVSVPFVGCRSGGQIGSAKAPSGEDRALPIGAAPARQLAYYSSSPGFGVLAPHGWYCFAIYGSGAMQLYVSPKQIDIQMLFSDKWGGLRGPAVQLDYRYGDTAGRFGVAEIIARVFPAYKAFAVRVMNEVTPPESFTFSPYPHDALTYRSKTVVEYTTPAGTDGLGTRSSLKKNSSPIEGVAMLVEPTPDLVQVAVRLPPDMRQLSSTIIHQIELDAAHRPQWVGVR